MVEVEPSRYVAEAFVGARSGGATGSVHQSFAAPATFIDFNAWPPGKYPESG
jgi:hypothetical protein